MKKLQKITIIFNRADDANLAADTDTEKSALDIAAVLKSKYKVDVLALDSKNLNQILKIKGDVIFNMVEWTVDHLSDVKKTFKNLHKTGIPFTGSDFDGYFLSCDKAIMKKAMDQKNIPTPKWQILKTGEEKIDELSYPLIVKPTTKHCGIGVTQDSFVKDEISLRAYAKKLIAEFSEPVLVEEFIEGRELHVTVLEKNGKPWVLPIAEVVFNSEENFAPVLTYDGKWNEHSPEYAKSFMQLADLEPKIKEKVTQIAARAYSNLGGRDYPRLDMRLRGSEVFVLEINNNPGIDFEEDSGFGLSGKTAGFTYEGILSHILESASSRSTSPAYDTSAS